MDFHPPAEKKSYWKPTTSNLFSLHISKIPTKQYSLQWSCRVQREKKTKHANQRWNEFVKGYLSLYKGYSTCSSYQVRTPFYLHQSKFPTVSVTNPPRTAPGDDTMALTLMYQHGNISVVNGTLWGKFVMFHWKKCSFDMILKKKREHLKTPPQKRKKWCDDISPFFFRLQKSEVTIFVPTVNNSNCSMIHTVQ